MHESVFDTSISHETKKKTDAKEWQAKEEEYLHHFSSDPEE